MNKHKNYKANASLGAQMLGKTHFFCMNIEVNAERKMDIMVSIFFSVDVFKPACVFLCGSPLNLYSTLVCHRTSSSTASHTDYSFLVIVQTKNTLSTITTFNQIFSVWRNRATAPV